MLRRLGHLLLLAAVLAVTGAHWAVLQSVAWTAMLAGNLQTDSFHVAVVKTFDGKHPCALCKQIACSQQAEKKSDTRFEWSWPEFSFAPTEFEFTAPTFCRETRAPDDFASPLSHAPLLPPPKPLRG